MLDNGYPQSTDAESLKIITEEAGKKGASLEDMKEIASQITGQIGWRRAGKLQPQPVSSFEGVPGA